MDSSEGDTMVPLPRSVPVNPPRRPSEGKTTSPTMRIGRVLWLTTP